MYKYIFVVYMGIYANMYFNKLLIYTQRFNEF